MQGLKEQISPLEIEIVLVDNKSEDHTIAKAQSLHDRIKVISIERYVPGASLNRGVEEAEGDFIVCVSAHCVPANENWLTELLEPLNKSDVAAVYGRQIPLLTSKANDKRDLWLTFGLDDKIQTTDPFLHNANAAYRRKDLVQHPFSETMTNIEDRSWANFELERGRKIYYASKAVIYHNHGINQSGCKDRLSGVIAMMDELHHQFDQFEFYYGDKLGVVLPSLCLIVPISNRYGDDDINALSNHANEIKSRFSDWKIYIMPTLSKHAEVSKNLGFDVLDFRVDLNESVGKPLVVDISSAVKCLTESERFYDYVATFDIRRWIPDTQFLDRAISTIQSEQTQAVIGATHKPKPTFESVTGEAFQMEYAGWLNWLEGVEVTSVPVLDPSAFLMAEMDVFRKGNPLRSNFSPIGLDE